MPYVSQYIAKYAKQIMQLSGVHGCVPSLDLDKLPLIGQICRYLLQAARNMIPAQHLLFLAKVIMQLFQTVTDWRLGLFMQCVASPDLSCL